MPFAIPHAGQSVCFLPFLPLTSLYEFSNWQNILQTHMEHYQQRDNWNVQRCVETKHHSSRQPYASEKKLGNSLEEAKNENLIELMGYNKSSSKKAAI